VPVVLLGCLLLAAVSLAFPSVPTYDPWAWLIWGREVLSLNLATTNGPSWKPLPVLFTTVFALAGDLAPSLWLVVARAGGLLAVVMAYRLTVRLVDGRGRVLGGVLAAVALLSISPLLRLTALGHSEGLLVALVLWSIERHLAGKPLPAFALGVAAALIRPEVWPFLGAYGLLLWLREPGLRWHVAFGLAAVPALWFLPELWGSGDALRASSRALAPDPGTATLTRNPPLEALRGAAGLLMWPLQAAALAGAAWAVARRERAIIALAGGGLAWIALVVAMTALGYPGVPRLMLPAVAIACVLAGVAAAHLVGLPKTRRIALLVGSLFVVAGAVAAAPRGPSVLDFATPLRDEAALHRDLALAVERAGGPDRVLACGRPATAPLQVPALAWLLRVPIATVSTDAQVPGVVFRAPDVMSSQSLPELADDDAALSRVAQVGDIHVLAGACPELATPSRPRAAPRARPARRTGTD
jgi:hypothetical protein